MTQNAGRYSGDSVELDGREVAGFTEVVAHVADEHPEMSLQTARSLVLNEYEAATGGTPVAVPVDVVEGVEELIADGRTEAPTRSDDVA
jgi:hypothetical protein